MSWFDLLKAVVEYTIGGSPRTLFHGTEEEGKVVKLPKGMRIGRSNNFIVESIHEINHRYIAGKTVLDTNLSLKLLLLLIV